MAVSSILTEEERARISAAIADAELQTSGEIVPFIVSRSDRYEVVVWRGAALGALLSVFAALLLMQFYAGWGLGWLYTGWGTASVGVVGAFVGAILVARIPALKRGLAGPALLSERVHDRAMRAFVEEEVFDTRDRTGILLFVSLLEHRIEVLGDVGINRKVEPEEWVEVVDRIRVGIRSGRLAEGFVEAIGMCGTLLHRRGVHIRPDDDDELPNEVRIRDE